MRRVFRRLLGLVVLLVPIAALAQEEPPARVGRVSVVDSNLAFHMRGETEWSAAAVNTPVAAGGTFWTDPKSKAELRIGSATLDLAPDTQLDIVNLNEEAAEFGVPKGRLRLHLRELKEGQSVAVDIPQGGVWLLQPGAYDIEAGGADRQARVAVFRGSARFVGEGAEIGVKSGEMAVLTGANPIAATLEHATRDAFDEWATTRDYAESHLAAPYYVSPHMTGVEALDRHGSWDTVAEYGEVWYPKVPAGWMPYSTGYWSWIAPWGWTWVDAEPWGFAPFHYGRWALVAGRWAWVPGGFVAQPVYAPALVAFLDAPADQGGPAIGWFPLAPGEPYRPSYSQNPDYVRRINTADVANAETLNAATADQHYANRRFATVAPLRVFAQSGPVAPAALRLAPETLERARLAAAPPAPGGNFGQPAEHPPARAAEAVAPEPPANRAALPPPRPSAMPSAVAPPPAAAPVPKPAATAEKRPPKPMPKPEAQTAAQEHAARAAHPPRIAETRSVSHPRPHAPQHAALPPTHAYRPIYVYPPSMRGYPVPGFGFEAPMRGYPVPPPMRGWPPPMRGYAVPPPMHGTGAPPLHPAPPERAAGKPEPRQDRHTDHHG